MKAIHQLVAGFSNGDAISNEARTLRGIFQSWGFESEIFSETRRILPRLRKEAHDISTLRERVQPADIVILHLSIGSVVNDLFPELNCRKALLYHNITPAHYFDLINQQIAFELSRGREQMKKLVNSAEVNLADSRYNAGELEALGYRNVEVLPLVLQFDKLTGDVDRKTRRRFGDGRNNIIFVGRVVPNKCCEDLLLAFQYYSRHVDEHARFIHVGSFSGTERYYYLLLAQAREMGLDNVYFAGAVPQAELNAFYQGASAFLNMSEHEGFCIPVIEAMHMGVPVVAYDAAAVPETMDGAGVLFRRKEMPAVAEMLGRVVREGPLRQAVLAGQSARMERFTNRQLADELRQHLAPLLPGAG